MTALEKLSDFNKYRKKGFVKDKTDENFLKQFNDYLVDFERDNYRDNLSIDHPLIFVFGLPRSGTTLMSQLVAYGLEVGYINNFIARFWKVPVTGIKLSKVLFKQNDISYESNYATTKHLTDIHDFGYFWRTYLKKESLEDVAHYKERENEIEWQLLYKIIANIQNEFGMGWAAKNLFGSYHIKKFTEIFRKVLFVYIERDTLDSAISILIARKKYYFDLSKWWSCAPPEIEQIKSLPYMQQIAGQVYYLKRFFDKQDAENKNVVKIQHKDVCQKPKYVLNFIQLSCKELFNYQLSLQEQNIPKQFNYREYNDRDDEKAEFEKLIQNFS